MIIHLCKGLWKLPAAQVLWMIRTCRSWITPEHERAISRKLKKNSLQKSLGFPRSLNVLSLLAFLWLWCIMDQVMMVHYVIKIVGWSWVRCKNCPFVRTPTQTHAAQPRQNSQRQTDWFFLLCDLMLMFRVAFAGARRMQRRDYPNACSAREIRGRDVPAR